MFRNSVSLREHLALLREAEERFQDERDRRYTEGAALRAEALKIKETGDSKALDLAREIQTYKDEKANDLRSQIERERGAYATGAELAAITAPLVDFVASERGRRGGIGLSASVLVGGLTAFGVAFGAVFALAGG